MNQNHKTRRAFARFTIALTLGGIGRSNKARGQTRRRPNWHNQRKP